MLFILRQKPTVMIKSILFTLIGSAIINFSVAQAPKPIAKTAEGFYNDGIKLKDQKKYPAAILSFKNAIAKNPNYKEAFYAAGWCSNELNKYSDALGYLQKAKTLWPDEAKVYLELGYANQQSGKDNEAKDCYNKCLSLKDDYSLAYQYLGNLFFSEKDYKKALQEYDSYSKYEPNITSATVYYKMGYCQDDAEKYNDAVSSLNKAISLKAGYVDAYNELGYANKKLEKADDAIKNYNDALRFDPKSTTAINGIGDVYKDVKKDMDEALKTFFRSLAIDPKNKKTNYLIGWCYNDKGKYNDAVPYLKKLSKQIRIIRMPLQSWAIAIMHSKIMMMLYACSTGLSLLIRQILLFIMPV